MATQNDNTILSKADLKAYHQKILPYLGGNAFLSTNHSDYYSIEEKMIGVWVDGKPLYQKTIIDTMPDNVTSGTMVNKKIDVSSLNIDKFANWFGMMKTSTGWCMLPHVDGSCNVTNGLNYGDSDSTLWLRNGNSFYNGATTYVTIQYTKTTDTAGSAATTPGAYDLNRPDLWPANKEIFFGDGLYGQRFTGTITSNGAATDLNVTVSSIINEGGQISFPNWVAAPAPFGITASNGNSAWGMIFKANSNSNLNINAWYFEGSTTVTYDVWVTYKK